MSPAPFGVSGMLSGTWRFAGSYRQVTIAPAALVMLVATIAQELRQVRGSRTVRDIGDAVAGGLSLLLALVLFPLLASILYTVLIPAVRGRTVPLGEAVRAALRRAPAMLGVGLVLGLIGAVIGFVIGAAITTSALVASYPTTGGVGIVVVVVLLAVATSAVLVQVGVTLVFAPAVVVVEGAGVGTALSRSRALVRGAWWRTFWPLLLAGVIAFVGSLLVGLLTGMVKNAIPPDMRLLSHLVAGLGSWVAGTVVVVFVAGFTGLLYVDRRIRTENFARDLAVRPGVPGA